MKNKEILKVLVGSHNYGLNTPSSDRDYKIFVLPTFDDLYNGKKISSSTIKDGNNEDYEIKDVRLLLDLLRKANPSYLEVLFSVEVNVNPKFENVWGFLLGHREDIVKYNLANFYNATRGTMCEKAKSLRQGKYTESSKELFDKFGYDTKQMCHFLRLHTLLESYRLGECIDCFGKCLSLENQDKEFLKDIKNGDWYINSKFLEQVVAQTLCNVDYMKDYFVNTEEERSKHEAIFDTANRMIKRLIEDQLQYQF